MRIYRSLAEVPADFGPCALTIGNFDGVHFGHRRILRQLIALAAGRGWKSAVLTFDPHPTRIVAPDRTPTLLTSPAHRAELMREEGIQEVLILPFTAELARLSPEDFVQQLLVDRLGARAVLVGDNFRFGYRQSGNVRLLAELGARLGFETDVVPAVSWRGRIVSSSGIRSILTAGRVSLAARLLQHPYALDGGVVGGRGVGSQQTVPTLNLAPDAGLVPASGVYVTRALDLETERQWNAITNIGYRPTFGESDRLSIETFLLDPFIGETPNRIRIEFLWRVRDERKFESPAALREQILRDVRVARNYFRRTRAWIGV
ncbi:MAG TPA: bifunctional riboflavin kinase/FAD synthetase [Bryobacteraceae bacterium]|jgi:riboflavin kinase/FMN adenylyltransferase|nr:bifunctional riboflavin kinase/FAD synthetase [Bryobacteraceae bacterium]